MAPIHLLSAVLEHVYGWYNSVVGQPTRHHDTIKTTTEKENNNGI